MTTNLIIEHDTSHRPLIRMRDRILFCTCWIMWVAIIAAFLRGCQWDLLAASLSRWLGAHVRFIQSMLQSLNVSVAYLAMIALVACAFLCWSWYQRLRRLRYHDKPSAAALPPEAMARHFQLDQTEVAAMQRERLVLVLHADNGAVQALRRLEFSSERRKATG